MYTEPQDLDRRALERLLQSHWGLGDVRLEYFPVGFGAHHWVTDVADGPERLFVTADDLTAGFQRGADADSAFAALDRAYRTAAALRDDEGLEFVLAPSADREGALLRRLDARYAVNVRPFLDGTASRAGAYADGEARRDVGRILGRLHAAGERLPRDLPLVEDFAVPRRAELHEALDELDRAWAFGPFGELARELMRVRADEVRRRLAAHDAVASEVAQTADSWVVTHGEPHAKNVLRDASGALHLLDWDTTLRAPRERDLRMVLDDRRTGWAEYVAAAGPASLDERVLRLYREAWDLSEIALYVDLFRRPHEDTEDTRAAWRGLRASLREP